MREFVKEQLIKTLDYFQDLIKKKKASTRKPLEVIKDELVNAKAFLSSTTSNLYLFTYSFEDYLKEEKNKYFKLAIRNDVRSLLDPLLNNKLLRAPLSFDRKEINDLEDWVYESIRLNVAEFLLNKIKFKPDQAYNVLEHISLLSESLSNKDEIIKNLYEHFIRVINYKIVMPYINAEVTSKIINSSKKIFFDGTEMKQEDINEYLENWLTRSVTLDEWLKFKKVDTFYELRQYENWEEISDEVYQHKFDLFNELQSRIFNYRYKEKFEKLPGEKAKTEIAQRDLALINDLIVGDINDVKADRVNTAFYIKDWKKVVIQFEHILRSNYVSEDNYDIHHKDSYMDAQLVLEYKAYLQKFLESSTQQNEIKPVNNLIKQAGPKNINKPTIISFGYKNQSHDFLKNLFKHLNLKMDFINEQETTQEDFINALTTNNFNTIAKPIKLGCETVQFSYIVEKLKVYFKSLNPTTIEKSKLFISKKGSIITATNLYKSKIDNPKNQAIIDNFFKQQQ